MSADLDTLLQLFLRERRYLRNLRPQTLEWYETAWKAFRKSATHCLTDPALLNRTHLEQFVYALRDRGVRPVTCNTWLRALNAFSRWRHENGHAPTRVQMHPLKTEKRLGETLDADIIRALVSFKPPLAVTVNKHHLNGPRSGQTNFAWWRIHALVCALLDTGCRVQALLDTRVEDFHMDDLLVTVVGKGHKQRRNPFSVELRRILFRYMQQRERFGAVASCRRLQRSGAPPGYLEALQGIREGDEDVNAGRPGRRTNCSMSSRGSMAFRVELTDCPQG